MINRSLLAVLIALLSSAHATGYTVSFADGELLAAVKKELGISYPPTDVDMRRLTKLDHSIYSSSGTGQPGTGIVDLDGLQWAVNLQTLKLDGNRVYDLTPISRRVSLKTLWLNGNQVNDLTPLAQLPALQELQLIGNPIRDLSPLSNLTSLSGLWVGSTQITDLSPLAGLVGLKVLQFSDTQVSDISPLAHLTNLQELYPYGTPVSDLSPLAGLTQLQTLVFSNNPITDISPLAGLSRLTRLNMWVTQVSDLSPLRNLTSLGELMVCWNPAVSDLSALTGLKNLDWLWMDGNQISNLSPLAGLTNLTRIQICYNKVSDLSPLAGLVKLTSLRLWDNQISDLSSLAGLRNLKTLNLVNNEVTSLLPLAGLTNLQMLHLSGNKISDLSPLVALTNVNDLTLMNNRIADISPLAGYRKLKKLYLTGNPLNDKAYQVYIPLIRQNNPGIDLLYDAPGIFVLSVAANGGGQVVEPGIGTFEYPRGSIVRIVAASGDANTFDRWSGSAVTAGAVADPYSRVTTVAMTGSYSITAEFLSRILYVDARAKGANNGSSWANAFKNLQDALNGASNGKQIWVAQGTYRPDQGRGITPGNRDATFQLKNGVMLYGAFAGNEDPPKFDLSSRDFAANRTILTGDLLGNDKGVIDPNESTRSDNSYSVVTVSYGAATLDGFTICGGHANSPIHPWTNDTQRKEGGAIRCVGASLTVANCTLEANYAGNGAGVSAQDGSYLQLRNCTVQDNVGEEVGAIMVGWPSSATMEDCVFSHNGLSGKNKYASVLFATDSDTTIRGCQISDNTTGGVAIWCSGGKMVIRDCVFERNSTGAVRVDGDADIFDSAFNNNSGYIGAINFPNANEGRHLGLYDCRFSGNQGKWYGAVRVWDGKLTCLNCVFTGNGGESYAGGMGGPFSGGADIVNCTFTGNYGPQGNALAFGGFDAFRVYNCILWDGGNEIYCDSKGKTGEIGYCDVQGGWSGSGPGIISADPKFDADLHLLPGSPCIDAGWNKAFFDASSSPIRDQLNQPMFDPVVETDLDGKARYSQSAAGRTATVDIGAYEFQGPSNSPHVKTWDLGTVKNDGSGPLDGIEFKGMLLFFADDGQHGQELMRYDPISGETRLVKDIRPGPEGLQDTKMLGVHDGWLYFLADDGSLSNEDQNYPAGGVRLWKTDGTEAGTWPVPGLPGKFGPLVNVDNWTPVDGTIYFTAKDPGDDSGIWLCRTDGTEVGTQKVKRMETRAGLLETGISSYYLHWSNSDPVTHPVAYNHTLYFLGSQPAYTAGATFTSPDWEYALCKTNGTELGTGPVVYPQDVGGRMNYLVATDSGLYFTAQDTKLYRSDGTKAGTTVLKEFKRILWLTVRNTVVYLWADDGVHGRELWATDGTPAGTVLLADINPGVGNISPGIVGVNNKGLMLFFANDGVHGEELWRTDGTQAGTCLVKDIIQEPAKSDEFATNFAMAGDLAYFYWDDDIHPIQLWQTDGTPAGTVPTNLMAQAPRGIWPLGIVDGVLYLDVDDGIHGAELWKTDGTQQGTVMVKDINQSHEVHTIDRMTVINGSLYVFAGQEVYKLDNPEGEFVTVDASQVPSDGGMPMPPSAISYYLESLSTGYTRLWRTDGTTQGTFALKPDQLLVLHPPLEGSWGLRIGQSLLLFSGKDKTADGKSQYGEELWITDGTQAGTYMLKDINPYGGSYPFGFTLASDGCIYFSADDGSSGRELWRTDLSGGGTTLVMDINPGPAGSNPQMLTYFKGYLFFTAQAADHTTKLFRLKAGN